MPSTSPPHPNVLHPLLASPFRAPSIPSAAATAAAAAAAAAAETIAHHPDVMSTPHHKHAPSHLHVTPFESVSTKSTPAPVSTGSSLASMAMSTCTTSPPLSRSSSPPSPAETTRDDLQPSVRAPPQDDEKTSSAEQTALPEPTLNQDRNHQFNDCESEDEDPHTQVFTALLQADAPVDPHDLRRAARQGIPHHARAAVWNFLLGVTQPDGTHDSSERLRRLSQYSALCASSSIVDDDSLSRSIRRALTRRKIHQQLSKLIIDGEENEWKVRNMQPNERQKRMTKHQEAQPCGECQFMTRSSRNPHPYAHYSKDVENPLPPPLPPPLNSFSDFETPHSHALPNGEQFYAYSLSHSHVSLNHATVSYPMSPKRNGSALSKQDQLQLEQPVREYVSGGNANRQTQYGHTEQWVSSSSSVSSSCSGCSVTCGEKTRPVKGSSSSPSSRSSSSGPSSEVVARYTRVIGAILEESGGTMAYDDDLVGLCGLFLTVMQDEGDAFIGLSALLEGSGHGRLFDDRADDLYEAVSNFLGLLRSEHCDLHDHLLTEDVDVHRWARRWLRGLLVGILDSRSLLHLWDRYLTDHVLNPNASTPTTTSSRQQQRQQHRLYARDGLGLGLHPFVCLVLVGRVKQDLFECDDAERIMPLLWKLPPADVDQVVALATALRDEYINGRNASIM